MIFTDEKAKQTKKPMPTSGLTIDGKAIKLETSVKYLGIMIDHKLKWDEHIHHKT